MGLSIVFAKFEKGLTKNMTKDIFKSMLIDIKDSNTQIALVLNAQHSHGSYSSSSSFICVKRNDIEIKDSYVEINIAHQSFINIMAMSGKVLIPYSEILFVITDFVTKEGF